MLKQNWGSEMIKRWVSSLFVALLLVGCAPWSSVSPEAPSTREVIASGYTTVATTADAVAIARRDGWITPSKATELLDRLQAAQATLNFAVSVEIDQPDKAAEAAGLAITVLNQITRELKR